MQHWNVFVLKTKIRTTDIKGWYQNCHPISKGDIKFCSKTFQLLLIAVISISIYRYLEFTLEKKTYHLFFMQMYELTHIADLQSTKHKPCSGTLQ